MDAARGAESERWCIVLVVVERDGSLVLHVEPTRTAVPCPACGTLSHRPHSRYQRRPLDLPWRGAILRIQPALDWSLRGSSAWVNVLSGRVRRDGP